MIYRTGPSANERARARYAVASIKAKDLRERWRRKFIWRPTVLDESERVGAVMQFVWIRYPSANPMDWGRYGGIEIHLGEPEYSIKRPE